MDPLVIVASVSVLAGLGVLFGVVLGFAGRILAVEEDETVARIREQLPGANCAGCGFPGCDQLAAAIAAKEAKVNACPVGGAASAEAIAAIMGADAGVNVKKEAFVKCAGCDAKASKTYSYQGMKDCRAASMLVGGGSKSCGEGCLGLGTCARLCPFGAIDMADGIAVVNREKCAACGVCVAACPRGLIALVPSASKFRVACSSSAPAKAVREVCGAGCIACKMCVRSCGHGAVAVKDNLALIDYDKCRDCAACAEKCPVKVIRRL